jgi:hypothetical protein
MVATINKIVESVVVPVPDLARDGVSARYRPFTALQ